MNIDIKYEWIVSQNYQEYLLWKVEEQKVGKSVKWQKQVTL